ncbi:MAG: helix-turn-helix domain-containing protein [Defluviicoccus sp.]
MDRLAFSIEESAKVLGVGRSHVYELIKRGLIVPAKLGRRTIIAKSELEAALHRLRAPAA